LQSRCYSADYALGARDDLVYGSQIGRRLRQIATAIATATTTFTPTTAMSTAIYKCSIAILGSLNFCDSAFVPENSGHKHRPTKIGPSWSPTEAISSNMGRASASVGALYVPWPVSHQVRQERNRLRSHRRDIVGAGRSCFRTSYDGKLQPRVTAGAFSSASVKQRSAGSSISSAFACRPWEP